MTKRISPAAALLAGSLAGSSWNSWLLPNSGMQVLVVFIVVVLVHQGNPLQCYRCSGSSRNANKADKACVYGYSNVGKQECPSDHVCSTYQYEISIHGLVKSSVTIRGCQPYELVDDCNELLKDMRSLVYPARVKELNCYSCASNLCNSLSNI